MTKYNVFEEFEPEFYFLITEGTLSAFPDIEFPLKYTQQIPA
jgi:hypothetical protein